MDHIPIDTPVKGRLWWTWFFLGGDFESPLVDDPEYIHFPSYDRKKAARKALYSTFSQWKFWSALVFLIAATIGLSVVDSTFQVCAGNGTIGAGLGFLIGISTLKWAIYQCGLPVYKEALKRSKQSAEQVAASDGP
jgi:bacteriorhodopsin